jgi:hypothetical protein
MQRSCTRTDPEGQVVTGLRFKAKLSTTQATTTAKTTPAIIHLIGSTYYPGGQPRRPASLQYRAHCARARTGRHCDGVTDD